MDSRGTGPPIAIAPTRPLLLPAGFPAPAVPHPRRAHLFAVGALDLSDATVYCLAVSGGNRNTGIRNASNMEGQAMRYR